MNSPGELAQLGDRLLDLVLRARQHIHIVRVTAGSREAECDGEGDESLLRPVVEVALESAPLGICRGDEPDARCPHLGELRAHLGRQTLVLEHEPCRRSNGLHQRRLIEQRRIVNERRDLFALNGHQCHRPIRALGELERPPVGGDVAAVVEAIRNVERRVAEYPGEPLAQAGCSSVRSSTTRSDASRRGSRDQTIPATTPSGMSNETPRPIVSSVGASVPVELTHAQPEQGRRER